MYRRIATELVVVVLTLVFVPVATRCGLIAAEEKKADPPSTKVDVSQISLDEVVITLADESQFSLGDTRVEIRGRTLTFTEYLLKDGKKMPRTEGELSRSKEARVEVRRVVVVEEKALRELLDVLLNKNQFHSCKLTLAKGFVPDMARPAVLETVSVKWAKKESRTEVLDRTANYEEDEGLTHFAGAWKAILEFAVRETHPEGWPKREGAPKAKSPGQDGKK